MAGHVITSIAEELIAPRAAIEAVDIGRAECREIDMYRV
jgi:hypothetical protein